MEPSSRREGLRGSLGEEHPISDLDGQKDLLCAGITGKGENEHNPEHVQRKPPSRLEGMVQYDRIAYHNHSAFEHVCNMVRPAVRAPSLSLPSARPTPVVYLQLQSF